LQPAVTVKGVIVGHDDRVEERALFDPAPRVRLVDR